MIASTAEGGVRTITLDRPDRRNALTPDGLDELGDAISDATEPVVYLQGAGKAFCAGADLDVVSGFDRAEAVAFARHGQHVTDLLESYEGAVVAGIDGAARGGGVELALACDLRVGTPSATLAESGVSLGLLGAWGGTARLPALVGEGHALDIGLSGRVLSAQEAHKIGLLSRVVERPRQVAEELAENDGHALAVIKQRIRDRDSRPVQNEREAEAFGDLIEHCDLSDR